MSFRSTLTIAILSFVFLLTGCGTQLKVTLPTVTFGGATFATNKGPIICDSDVATERNRRGNETSKTEVLNCKRSQMLGNKACVLNWQEVRYSLNSGRPTSAYNYELKCTELKTSETQVCLVYTTDTYSGNQGNYYGSGDRTTSRVDKVDCKPLPKP